MLKLAVPFKEYLPEKTLDIEPTSLGHDRNTRCVNKSPAPKCLKTTRHMLDTRRLASNSMG
jgi:hypothetical protein